MTEPFAEPPASLFSLTQIQHLMRVEFSRAQRYGYPLGVLVVEVDGLAALRDEQGYAARQDALSSVSSLMQRTTRSCDFLGRLVDDRLMAVLPHTRTEGVARTAERLLAGARDLGLERGVPGVRLNIGYSVFDGGSTLFFDALVDAAEAGLIEARTHGGDRAVLRSPAGSTH